jgi:hypothetical protein
MVTVNSIASGFRAGACGHGRTESAQYWRATIYRSDHQAVRAFNAIDPPMATQTMEPSAHRYHGGPKSND